MIYFENFIGRASSDIADQLHASYGILQILKNKNPSRDMLLTTIENRPDYVKKNANILEKRSILFDSDFLIKLAKDRVRCPKSVWYLIS